MRSFTKRLFPVLFPAFMLLGLSIAAAGTPSPSPQVSKDTLQSPGIQLIGIVNSESKTRALVAMKGMEDGALIGEGDLVGGYTVLRIGEETVELGKGEDQQVLAIPGVEWLKPVAEKIQVAARPFEKKDGGELGKALAGSVNTLKAASPRGDKMSEAGTRKPALINQMPKFRSPMGGRISSGFGLRRTFRTNSGQWGSEHHEGVDIAAPLGSPVHAAADGTVVESAGSALEQRGRHVIIRHSGGYETHYYHLSRRYVKAGDTVKAGQKIASEGNTGSTTGPHLHFEIRKNGVALDPALFVSSLRGR
jgi:murein DD-endopeptidase MepM/ murein hydrolase activator NlpD